MMKSRSFDENMTMRLMDKLEVVINRCVNCQGEGAEAVRDVPWSSHKTPSSSAHDVISHTMDAPCVS